MNYLIHDFDDSESTYSVHFRKNSDGSADKTARSSRPIMGRRRGKSPQQFNGMHRRRRKKIRW